MTGLVFLLNDLIIIAHDIIIITYYITSKTKV